MRIGEGGGKRGSRWRRRKGKGQEAYKAGQPQSIIERGRSVGLFDEICFSAVRIEVPGIVHSAFVKETGAGGASPTHTHTHTHRERERENNEGLTFIFSLELSSVSYFKF